MAATVIDSSVLTGLFTTPAMRRVFSDETRVQLYLDVEAALARVQARLAIIPKRPPPKSKPRRSSQTSTSKSSSSRPKRPVRRCFR